MPTANLSFLCCFRYVDDICIIKGNSHIDDDLVKAVNAMRSRITLTV